MKHLSAICQKTLSVPGAKLHVGFSQGAPVLPAVLNCSWHSSSSPGLPKLDVCMWRHWPDWQEFLAWHKANAALNNAQCQLWFRYSSDESYGYSQEIEGNDDFKDLRKEALSAVFRFWWHCLMSSFDAHREVNTAIEQNWLWMHWLSSVTKGKVPGLDLQEESWPGNALGIYWDTHALVTQRFLCSSTSHEAVSMGQWQPETYLGTAVHELHVPAAWLQSPCPIHAGSQRAQGLSKPHSYLSAFSPSNEL